MSGFVWKLKRAQVLKRTAADVFGKEDEDEEEDGEVRTIVL